MSATYKIVKFGDLLRVPAERRDDCMRELQYGLALLELAFEEGEALVHAAEGFTWTDDGERRIDLMQVDGTPLLTLEIEAAAASQEGAP